MLIISIPGYEYFDEKIEEFGRIEPTTLRLEHSLKSVSRWESKWNQPFFGKEKTKEQCIDYVRCMTIDPNVNPLVYLGLTDENIRMINQYIEAPMTATWFSEKETKKFNQNALTAEVIYYYMVALNIPFDCDEWHINRLITLIRVCNAKNAPKRKQTMWEKRDELERRRALNAARKRRLNSNG